MTPHVMLLTDEQKDALKEVASVMIGHAATALARVSSSRIDVEIPAIDFVPWTEGVKRVLGGDRIVAGVRTRMLGELAGEVYVTFSRESALALVDVLLAHKVGSTTYMNATAASALVEVGNIMAGSCLAAFHQFLDISLVHSVPEFIYDFADALAPSDRPLGGIDGQALLARVVLRAPEHQVEGSIILLFTVESMSSLLAALESQV